MISHLFFTLVVLLAMNIFVLSFESEILIELLNSFGKAFNEHDSEKLISMMTDDCEFLTSAGSFPFGNSIIGKEAVKKTFDQTFASFPDSQWIPRNSNQIIGNRGFSEWTFKGTRLSDNAYFEVDGVDIFTFGDDGKIAIKDAYRKDRPPIFPTTEL